MTYENSLLNIAEMAVSVAGKTVKLSLFACPTCNSPHTTELQRRYHELLSLRDLDVHPTVLTRHQETTPLKSKPKVDW